MKFSRFIVLCAFLTAFIGMGVYCWLQEAGVYSANPAPDPPAILANPGCPCDCPDCCHCGGRCTCCQCKCSCGKCSCEPAEVVPDCAKCEPPALTKAEFEKFKAELRECKCCPIAPAPPAPPIEPKKKEPVRPSPQSAKAKFKSCQ